MRGRLVLMERPFCVVELKDFCLRVSLVIVKKFPVIGFVDGSQSASVRVLPLVAYHHFQLETYNKR